MVRVEDAGEELVWLESAPWFDLVTGIDPEGWAANTWVLHSIYINDSLPIGPTHHQVRQYAIEQALLEPEIVGDVNLDAELITPGGGLGYMARPGQEWRRTTWRASGAVMDGQQYPPSFRWFPVTSHPAAVVPPTEGSLDQEALSGVLDILERHSSSGGDTECLAFYASLPAHDFDELHLWRGPLGDIPSLIDANGGPYRASPSNLWPVDRSWMVSTHWDLTGTRISGAPELVEALRSSDQLETVDWIYLREPNR